MSGIPSCSLKAAEPQCHKRIVDQSLDSPSKCRIEMVMLKLGLSRDELPFDGPSMYCQIYRTLTDLTIYPAQLCIPGYSMLRILTP